ncbi:hypothetical protein HHK36_014466 [Tetracentron sinense]|uniref:Uncharacterized protein n=1 Tax=Tetracentron sinense TaxID=13715 RepID=A0A835DHR7_TETSI|nr:hypothetical protein HHK36_014466 [Tetracentron sinense]
MVKNNYMRPNPNAPSTRGCGRPPKPKLPLPSGTLISLLRPRGRPPKPRDPSTMAEPLKASSGSEKSRRCGRPPKNARTTTAAATTPPRTLGRPPKVKTPIAAVGFD